MAISSVRHSNVENTTIVVESTSGGWQQVWPSGTYLDSEIHLWLDAGGQIDPYDPQYGWTLEQVKVAKVREGEEYGRELIRQAHANPYSTVTVVDTKIYREKIQSRRRLRSDKKALAKPLTQDEELQLARDEVLQEYEVLCIACSNEFNDLVDEADTPEQVNALNPATDIIWPVWTPPA